MSDPVGGSFGGIGSFVEEHPYATAGIAVGTILIIWLLMSGSSSSTAATGSTSDSTTAAAAAVQDAQITADAQTASNTIAAGVTNNQTAAAQTVALAQITGQTQAAVASSAATTASAYYGAATEIANSNSAVAITQTQAQEAEQITGDQAIASEFSNLAGVLTSFGANAQSITNNTNSTAVSLENGIGGAATGAGQTPLLPIPVGTVSGSNPFASITSALLGQSAINSTVATNAGIQAQNQANFSSSLAATTGYASAALGSTSAGASSAISSLGSWLSGLFSAFGSSTAKTAPVTSAPSATDVAKINLQPLAGGPQLPNLASITPF